MRRTLFSITIVGVTLIVFGSSSVLNSKVKDGTTVVTLRPGTRCTRLTFGPKEKKKSKKELETAESSGAMPGTRCLRLRSGGRPGTILPNAPPNVGLAKATAYVAANADRKVDVRAIACDPDGDNVLYTYSTTGGLITGDGPTAMWDLSGVTRPGTYTVAVEVDDGCGCITFESSTVTLE